MVNPKLIAKASEGPTEAVEDVVTDKAMVASLLTDRQEGEAVSTCDSSAFVDRKVSLSSFESGTSKQSSSEPRGNSVVNTEATLSIGNDIRRPRNQDSAHALLSLGKVLSTDGDEEQDEAQKDGDRGISKRIKLEGLQSCAVAPLSNQGKKSVGVEAGDISLVTVDNKETPNDFWYWLPPDHPVRDNDVICGRGGESNNYVGNKKFRIVIKDRKVSFVGSTLVLDSRSPFDICQCAHVEN
jgi:hypothetical protein